MRKNNRVIGFVLTMAVCGILVIAGVILSKKSSCRMEDAKGNLLAEIRREQKEFVLECGEDDWSYVDAAFHEASCFFAEKENITEEEAEDRLVKDGAVIRTNYQKEIQEALTKAAEGSPEAGRSNLAGAVSDTEGHLLACYSYSAEKDGKNYVTYPVWAGSTMKPVSVYGPAIEEDIICWSSMEEDSPFMQVEDEEGKKRDWPENTSAYTYENKTMAQALKESNNAIAVKTLKKLGMSDSLDWLKNRFQYTVDGEQRMLREKKENEIYDNVALGYLEAGVTVKQMVENYQVFAASGKKQTLRAVDYIEEKNSVLRVEEEPQQIFSEETAYIVNRMLKGVVSEGGTGSGAVLEDVDLCGKTGTSDGYKDNWFIGMTPQYLCGVWYSCENEESYIKNEAVSICREVINALPDQRNLEFVCPDTVWQRSFCAQTGLIAGEECAETEQGYYKKDSPMQICNCRSALTIKQQEAKEEKNDQN